MNKSSIGRCGSCDHLRRVEPEAEGWRDSDGRRLDVRRDICALTQSKPDPDPCGCRRYRMTIRAAVSGPPGPALVLGAVKIE